MKIVVLNKKEQETLSRILSNLIVKPGCPYEVTTILEKIDTKMYEYTFNKKG